MSKMETVLEDGLRSDLLLQQQLRVISETLRQQLQETARQQTEELEKRIHQNSLLSTEDQESVNKNELNHEIKRSSSEDASMFALTSDKEPAHHTRQSEMSRSSSPSVASSTNRKHCSLRTSMLAAIRTQHCERLILSKTTQMRKEEEAEAECQKKFCALPAPSHVNQTLYQDMVEMKEKERKQGQEQRKNFLLSMQKPFSFQEREKEKKEKLIAMLTQVSQDQKNKTAAVRKPPYKVEKELLDQEDVCRKVSTQTTAQQQNHPAFASPKLRTAERTRKEKLAYLYEKPSFRPKIIHQVPDFSSLHKALQSEGLRKTQNKEVTKCEPFCLRTSALPARQNKTIPENSQAPKINSLSRSKSLGALTSLSTDTLPTYITDATRKRCMAIRKSIEMRESKNQESEDWLRKYQMRAQAMKTTVALHAKLLDPHSSLNEVQNEKVQQHREVDRQRMKEYMRELQEMKARVSERPYLFEQVKQRCAKARTEETFKNKLRKTGLKEEFVEKNCEPVERVSISSRSEDDCGTENDSQSREENVDDGEKIEDLEEESVKSKREEMP